MRQIVTVLFAGVILLTIGSGRGEAAGPLRNWIREHRPGVVFPKPSVVIRVPQPMPQRPAPAGVAQGCLGGVCPLPKSLPQSPVPPPESRPLPVQRR